MSNLGNETLSLINIPNASFQGVTYCGDSKASSLTMENVPWHDEVSAARDYVFTLQLHYSVIYGFTVLRFDPVPATSAKQ